MGVRRLVTGVFGLVVAGLVSATPVGAQTAGAALRVEPGSGLFDGQVVRYEGSGFLPGSGIAILQCTPGATGLTEVLAKCSVRQSATVDATGEVRGFVTVQRMLQPMSGGTGPVDCAAAAGACAISAFDLSSTVVDALITFADPAAQPALAVSPASDLDDGDVVTVTGSNFPAGADVTVAQCDLSRPATSDWCDDRQPVAVSADAAGGFVAEVTIHRGITPPSGSVIDCASSSGTPCAIAAFTSDGAFWAKTPIALNFRRLLAAASSRLVVSPQGNVEVTGSLFCSPPTSGEVEISGTITQTLEDRVITMDFSTTTTCPTFFGSWSTSVGGSRTQRFKVGTANITTWAVEATDPVPGDAERLSTEVALVRAL